MDIAVEDAVGPRLLLAVVERQRDDVLEEGGLLERLHGRVQVALVREVDALQDGPLRVEQVAVVALAGEAVGGQVAVGAGACPAPTAQVEAQLLAPAVAPGAGVGACMGRGAGGGGGTTPGEHHSNITSKEHHRNHTLDLGCFGRGEIHSFKAVLMWKCSTSTIQPHNACNKGVCVCVYTRLNKIIKLKPQPFSRPRLKTVTSFRLTPRPLLIVTASVASFL